MTTAHLATIGLLAPWMAWGAVAAVGLPVLAHLLSKTRYREVDFPAARLVQRAVAAASRIERPRHRLLMLLRWVVLLLLVLAFMRPQWTPDAEATGHERGVVLVVLIDASASMQRTADGLSLFDRAKSQAQRLINQLDPSRDAAVVIRVDHAPSALLPEPTARFSLLSERLNSEEPGFTRANWAGAVAAAQRLTLDERRPVRLVTLSDQQGDRPDLAADHLRIVGPTDNTSVRLVDVRPYPAIQGQPVTATVEVQHFGQQPTRVHLSAQLAGQTVKQMLTLEPGGTRRIDLPFPAASGEREVIEITLDSPDALAADNITGAMIPTEQSTRALVIHDADGRSPSIARRVALLLNPGEVARVTLPTVEVVTVDEAEAVLKATDPASLRTVVLVNRAPIAETLSQSLEAYAQAGGGIVRFVGGDSGTPGQTTTAAEIDFDLPPLRLFQGPARAGLATLRWPGVTNAPIAPAAQAILTDEQGRVIVAEMLRGRGRLIAINAALSDGLGGLLAEPAFVVLFNELCRYASPGPALPPPAKPGDPLPDQLLNAANMLVAEGADADSERFTTPGPYAAMGETGQVEALVYAQLDPSESNTTPPAAWSDSADAPNNPAQGQADAIAGSLRQDPVELWPYLVLGVLGLLAVESVLLRQYAGRPTAPMVQGGAV